MLAPGCQVIVLCSSGCAGAALPRSRSPRVRPKWTAMPSTPFPSPCCAGPRPPNAPALAFPCVAAELLSAACIRLPGCRSPDGVIVMRSVQPTRDRTKSCLGPAPAPSTHSSVACPFPNLTTRDSMRIRGRSEFDRSPSPPARFRDRDASRTSRLSLAPSAAALQRRNLPPSLPLCTDSLVAGADRDRPRGRRSTSTPCHPEHFSATVLTFVVVS